MENSLPKGWIEVPVEELMLTFQKGTNVKSKTSDGDIYFIPSGANFPTGIKKDRVKYISKEEFNAIEDKYVLQDGDILFNSGGVGTLGRSGYFQKIDKDAICDSFIIIIRDETKSINTKYLFYWLQTSAAQELIKDNTQGTTGITSIKAKDIQTFKFPLAPRAEQDRIVAKLDEVINRVTSIKNRIGQIDLLLYKFFLRNIQDLHPTIKLEEVCTEQTSTIGANWSNHKLIGVSKDHGVTNLRTGGKKTFEKYKVVKSGWFLYNPMRVDIGSIAIWEGKEDAITSPDYIVFSVNEKVSSKILLMFLKSSYGLSEINNNTQGAVRSRLYFKNLAKINFPYSGQIAHQHADLIFTGLSKFSKNKTKLEEFLNKMLERVFSKAFEGKLVKQKLNEEPAKNLLERIKKEKELQTLLSKAVKKEKTKLTMAEKLALVDVLKKNGYTLDAKALWEQSVFADDIDAFYEALKLEIEVNKTITQLEDKTLTLAHED